MSSCETSGEGQRGIEVTTGKLPSSSEPVVPPAVVQSEDKTEKEDSQIKPETGNGCQLVDKNAKM